MLTHIAIRDFAIIDVLELDLAKGMTVLTGETGAGKSILVDALGLLLGDRADAGVIRHGAERAEIAAEFDLAGSTAAAAWLKDQDLAAGDACILRRIVSRDGRSRGQINSRSVPLQALRELGEQLLDIHGQHEHQSLLRHDTQMALVDSYGDHGALQQHMADLYKDWKAVHEKLTTLQAAAADRDARLETLCYQVNELEALKLSPGELASIDDEHRRLANSGRLLEGAQSSLDWLYENEEGSAYQLVSQALARLQPLDDVDIRLKAINEMLTTAQAQISEGSDALRRYLNGLDMDPQRLEWLENRLASLHQLARKHRIEPADLPHRLQALTKELGELEHAGIALQELEAQLQALRAACREQAEVLHDRRSSTAAELGRKVAGVMQELGMPGGRFAIDVTLQDTEQPTTRGGGRIEFLVSANKGQPLMPLTKVASGGELSRIALAIQVIAAQASAIPAMVFDEVDAGIGGGVAEIVGRRLRTLGERRQVLCVTHLPQVASQAHNHLRVIKETRGNTTLTRIETLDRKAQVEELARMLGGVEITETTRKHAREMLARSG